MQTYTTEAIINSKTDEKEKVEETKKVILTNDAYAICEFLEQLKRELSRR